MFKEIGQPAFDEIVVESTLTVRGKSGSRSGKSLVNDSPQKSEALSQTSKAEIIDGSSAVQNRNRRDLSDRLVKS